MAKFATFIGILTCLTPVFASESSSETPEQRFRETLLARQRAAEPAPDAFLIFVKTFYNPDGTPVTEHQILQQSGASEALTPEMTEIFNAHFNEMASRIIFVGSQEENLRNFEHEFKDHDFASAVIRTVQRTYEDAEVFAKPMRLGVLVQMGSRKDRGVIREMIRGLSVGCRENLNECVSRLVAALHENQRWIQVLDYDSAVDLVRLIDSTAVRGTHDYKIKTRIKNILLSRFMRSGPDTCAYWLVEPDEP